MEEINFNTVEQFNYYNGCATRHPLVSVVRVENTEHIRANVTHYGIYAIYLKENKGCRLSYGRTPYDFDEMTVTSFAPGQSVRVEPNPEVPFAKFTALVFHPDLLSRTGLGRQIGRYEFFDYTSNEALHMSASEVETFRGVVSMIDQELGHAIDKHTRELIVSNIELLLNYCLRFYDRQFITREEINHGVMTKFMTMLKEYVRERAVEEGLPTVSYFADRCNYSTKYFGELVKTETGRTAKELIGEAILLQAEQLLSEEHNTVTEVGRQLGFDYPQHFIRFFKTMTGKTPNQWRAA